MNTPIAGTDLFSEVYLLETRRESILDTYGSSPHQDELRAELADIDATLQKHYSFMSDRVWSGYAY